MSGMNTRGVAFIGTGNIANAHAQALATVKGFSLVSVFDSNQAAAEKFAKQYKVPNVAASIEALLADPSVEIVHVLTPPDSHLELVEKCINAGKRVFTEKPVYTKLADGPRLAALLSGKDKSSGVNQNFVFFPAFAEFRERLKKGDFGNLKHLDVSFHPALRQLAAKQFTHWMFASPLNMLLEQAVHPLSQVLSIVEDVDVKTVSSAKPVMLTKAAGFYSEMQVLMRSAATSVNFHFMVGAAYPTWRLTAYCDDGVVTVDMINNTLAVSERTRYMDQVDFFLSGAKTAKGLFKGGASNLIAYTKSQLGLGARADSFFLSVKGSVDHFYGCLRADSVPITSGAFGARLVELCGAISAQLPAIAPVETTTASMSPPAPTGPIVLLIGGTGFIGKPTVIALLAAGYRVKVMARGVQNLPDVFASEGVTLVRGDVKNVESIRAAMQGADFVVNLAHGGGGANFEEIRRAMVDSAVAVAQAAIDAKVKRLVQVGSIAGLYLGNAADTVVGATPPDPQPEKRADYSRAKALADIAFEQACNKSTMEWVILRPGVVVGDGTGAIHSGLGLANNDQHVIGWNQGTNALPFVLVEDVASAIVGSLGSAQANKMSYNLAGDVAMSAREFVSELAVTQRRPIKFYPSSARSLWLVDVGKYLVKRVGGRRPPFPSERDFLSRGMLAKFDCSDAKKDLNWKPVSSRDEFVKKAIHIHG
jgi:2-alkyl-3-oxoalkanoate reductase